MFYRTKIAFNLCIVWRSGTASRTWHLLTSILWQLLREIFYSNFCLKLAEHVFAYCSIVYNCCLIVHEKRIKSDVSLFFHTEYLLYVQKRPSRCTCCDVCKQAHIILKKTHWFRFTEFSNLRLSVYTPYAHKKGINQCSSVYTF